MLTRCVTAYSSYCSHIVLVYLHPFRCNSLLKCALEPKIIKKSLKTLTGVHDLFIYLLVQH